MCWIPFRVSIKNLALLCPRVPLQVAYSIKNRKLGLPVKLAAKYKREESKHMRSKMLATVAFCSISLLWYNGEKGIYQVGWRKRKEDLSSNWKIGEDRKKIKTVYLLSSIHRALLQLLLSCCWKPSGFPGVARNLTFWLWAKETLGNFVPRWSVLSHCSSSWKKGRLAIHGCAPSQNSWRLSNVRKNICCYCLAYSTIS